MSATETEERIYSRVGGWLCLDFTNTIQSYSLDKPNYDYFRGYEDLTTWARQAELITEQEEEALNRQASEMPARADELLERARALRGTINKVFSAIANERQPDGEALEALNRELAEAMSHARVAQAEDGFEWAWTDFPERMDSLLWPIVRSAADLLVSHDKLERVRECGGDSCGWLFVDTSKNRSRRWCDMRDCGNTAKAKRHYHRVKAAGTGR
jgi:predicted RNA-binding Zn ribbon-like protein